MQPFYLILPFYMTLVSLKIHLLSWNNFKVARTNAVNWRLTKAILHIVKIT
jgi:hypothetical protein